METLVDNFMGIFETSGGTFGGGGGMEGKLEGIIGGRPGKASAKISKIINDEFFKVCISIKKHYFL